MKDFRRERMKDSKNIFEGVVAHGPLDIQDKLNECRFFLNLMKCNEKWNEFRWLTSAFLNGARAALDWLGWTTHNSRINEYGESEPDNRAIKNLAKYIEMREAKNGKIFVSPINSTLLELCKYRRVTAHQDSLRIRPEKVSHPEEFIFGDDGKRVIAFGEEILNVLRKMQKEVFQ